MFSVREIAAHVRGELTEAVDATPTRIVHDSRQVAPGDLFVALPGTRTTGDAFVDDAFARGACAALVASVEGSSKGDGRPRIVVPDALDALQQLARAWRDRLAKTTIVAVTGSNGKTTTRSLLAHVLRACGGVHEPPENYNTEIGLPLALLRTPETAEVGVFELGTERPGEIELLTSILRPSIGILTGVGPSHLAGFGSAERVAEEKWDLVRGLPDDGLLFVNGDDVLLRPRAEGERRATVAVGLGDADLRGRIVAAVPRLVVRVDDPPLRLETPLVGAHNATNVLLAVACALRLGVPSGAIEERAKSFVPIPHRLRLRPAPFGVLLDDVYNANPASMAAALDVLAAYGSPSTRRLFVFGDMLGLGDAGPEHHRAIRDLAVRLGIDIVPAGPLAVDACAEIASDRILSIPLAGRAAALRHLLFGRENAVLVKGSRALRLEDLVDELLASD